MGSTSHDDAGQRFDPTKAGSAREPALQRERSTECRKLPRDARGFLSYQLIRNVLAAHNGHCSFCVMLDARRPDLREAWFAVMSCIRIVDLRLRCKVLTWQELAEALPGKLQRFLQEKYGIASGNNPSTVLRDELFAANV